MKKKIVVGMTIWFEGKSGPKLGFHYPHGMNMNGMRSQEVKKPTGYIIGISVCH